ncbi:SMAD/FHA domain-containing protein, partial [Tricharina praecox]
MLPSGIATTSHIVSHASSSNSNNNSSSATTTSSANSGSRTGRLRGLSYLRSYAHGHSHSHNNNNNNNHNTGNHNTGNHNNGNGQPANATIVTTTTTTTTITSSSSASPSFANSWNPSSPPASSRPPRQRRATSPLNNTALNSWIPTVSGVSGLSRVVSLPAAELSTPTVHATNVPPPPNDGSDPSSAVRSIDQTISSHGPSFSSQQQSSAMVTANSNGARAGLHPDNQPLPSIRFTPYIDLRSNRESLHFAPIERCLRQKDEHIRVGRASERDANNPHAPVGFSSKVVSRRHCEFWCDNGQWFVKDVKSSSGTFLNHIRLSAPGMESKAYPLNDGDILQLGIDFKGGEEQIFRCVKIRVELNRAWQKALNNF